MTPTLTSTFLTVTLDILQLSKTNLVSSFWKSVIQINLDSPLRPNNKIWLNVFDLTIKNKIVLIRELSRYETILLWNFSDQRYSSFNNQWR